MMNVVISYTFSYREITIFRNPNFLERKSKLSFSNCYLNISKLKDIRIVHTGPGKSLQKQSILSLGYLNFQVSQNRLSEMAIHLHTTAPKIQQLAVQS
jgi:hypothetical protein